MNKTSVLIVDDHTIVRLGLKTLFDAEPDLITVGAAKNGQEAITLAKQLHPNVIVMDLVMPKMDGVETTREILHRLPNTRIILLTSFGSADGVSQVFKYGAAGAVMKTEDESILVTAVRQVAEGKRFISPEIDKQLAADPPTCELTSRQKEVLESMVRGLTNSEIAVQLGIRKDSVEDHINTIFKKLGAANRAEAVAIALRKHLLKV